MQNLQEVCTDILTHLALTTCHQTTIKSKRTKTLAKDLLIKLLKAEVKDSNIYCIKVLSQPTSTALYFKALASVFEPFFSFIGES